jgi:hypothetical protein
MVQRGRAGKYFRLRWGTWRDRRFLSEAVTVPNDALLSLRKNYPLQIESRRDS